VAGQRVGLSIRDVDQKTGRDLLVIDPAKAAAAPGSRPGTGLQGISGIKVNPDDFNETVKRWVWGRWGGVRPADAQWMPPPPPPLNTHQKKNTATPPLQARQEAHRDGEVGVQAADAGRGAGREGAPAV
jgi:hypothetical protein